MFTRGRFDRFCGAKDGLRGVFCSRTACATVLVMASVVVALPVLAASRGELRQVASPAALASIVDGTWTNDTLARTIPPGPYAYNADLGVIAYTPSFDTNCIAAHEPSTNGVVVLYRVIVTETNTTPRERVYRNTLSVPVYTTTVSTAGYPTSWIEDVYGNPPPWLSGSNLADWYANRDPARQRVHVVLIATSDVPAYVAMLTNAVGSITSGTNMIPLLNLYSNDIAFVHLAAGNGPNLYLHAPEDVQRLDIYDSTNLVPLMGEWLLSATLDHVSDPLLWTWQGAASNVFFSAGNPDVDNDGDGLADIREIRLYGTNPTKRDTDGDGLSDGAEVLIYDLDPLDTDSDDDTLSDGWEVFVALYPTDPDAGSPVTIAGVFGDYASGGAKSERYVLHALPFGSTNLAVAYCVWTNATTNIATAFTNTVARGTACTWNLRWWSHAADGRPILYDHDYQWTVDGVPTNTLAWYWLERCVVDQTRTNAFIYSAYTNSTISTNFVTKGHLGNHYVNLPTQDFDFAAPLSATPLVNSPPGKRVDVYVPLVDLDPANASNVVADAWIGEGESPGTIIGVSTDVLRRVRFTRGPESMPTGTVTLAIVSGADRIRVWRDPAKGSSNLLLSSSATLTNWVLSGTSTWSAIPTNVWVEGVTNSASAGDVILAARFTSPASAVLCADTNIFTILKVELDFYVNLTTWPEVGGRSSAAADNVYVRVHPTLSVTIDDLLAMGFPLRIHSSETLPSGYLDSYVAAADYAYTLASGDIGVIYKPPTLESLGVLPTPESDSIQEFTSCDNATAGGGSDHSDSDAFDAQMLAKGFVRRGKARDNGDYSTLTSKANYDFMVQGGVQFIWFSMCGAETEKRQIRDQADWLYWSGHGHHNNGKLATLDAEIAAGDVLWNTDLEVAVLAGCSVLDIKDFRAQSFGMITYAEWLLEGGDWSPGAQWENTGPQYLLGYCWKAPLDTDGTAGIVNSFFTAYNGGAAIPAAWGTANNLAIGRNACVIDTSVTPHEFWYWDETSGTPVWTKKVKGGTGW